MRRVDVPLNGVNGTKLLSADETVGGRTVLVAMVRLKMSGCLERQTARRAAELVVIGRRVRLPVMGLNASRRAEVLPTASMPAQVPGTGWRLRQFKVTELGLVCVQGIDRLERLRTVVTEAFRFNRWLVVRWRDFNLGFYNQKQRTLWKTGE